MKKPNRIGRKGKQAASPLQSKQGRTGPKSKRGKGTHRVGLSPATPGEKLLYARIRIGLEVGKEIASFKEDLGPGETEPLKTYTLYEIDGRFRLAETSFERFHGRRWMPFEAFLRLPVAVQDSSPHLRRDGSPALRMRTRARILKRDEAVRLVRDKVLFPAINAAIPACMDRDLWATVGTVCSRTRKGSAERGARDECHIVGATPVPIPPGVRLHLP